MMSSCASYNNKSAFSMSGPSSETQSEISSIDSDWSDVRTIALKLGVSNPDDLVTERFKIDRQKLENLIKTESTVEGVNSAEHFFDTVMKNTSTYISWPCRLKIGAKTKKDPHVRIVGKPENVPRAKERVLSCLDSRGTRVIMKMDVSYTDHSYIIGRGGNNIRRIMESTSTHIHFPDSNRSNPTEKSNQVSLCGPLEGVERARSLVRFSTPLLISFELPIMGPGQHQPDHDTPYIKEVESNCSVQVIFSTRPKLHSSLVLVKGSEKEAEKVQKATQLLINFTCESIASQIQVHMQLEISPQHHEIVKGRNNMNLLSIMERTKTKIIFPDVTDLNIKPIKKSQVTITGSIEGVYKARQQLIGNLPVALIFDFPDTQDNSLEIVNLSQKFGVFISIRKKQRQSTMSVVIKGVEKFIDKVYEARHEILKLTTPMVTPEIPETYFSPRDKDVEMSFRKSLTSLLSNYSDHSSISTVGTSPSSNFRFNNLSPYQKTPANHISPIDTSKFIPQQNMHASQPFNNNFLSAAPAMRQSLSPRSTANTSGYQSFSGSTNSLEQLYPGCNNGSVPSTSRAHYSPDSTYLPDTQSSRDCGLAGSNYNSNEYKPPHYDSKQPRSFDFDLKRVIGMKAIERAPNGEPRTPNSNWIGLGLSGTSPGHIETSNDMTWNHVHSSLYNLASTTGIVDAIPTNRRTQLSQCKDIHSLLSILGLEHYIKTFVVNEIDLDTFITLTEANLVELGITALGARKRLLGAIHNLLTEFVNYPLPSPTSPRFSGSAAPGAERRTPGGW